MDQQSYLLARVHTEASKTKDPGRREEGHPAQNPVPTSHSPVLLFGLHDDKIPLVINLLVQEIIIFLEKENKMRQLASQDRPQTAGQNTTNQQRIATAFHSPVTPTASKQHA